MALIGKASNDALEIATPVLKLLVTLVEFNGSMGDNGE